MIGWVNIREVLARGKYMKLGYYIVVFCLVLGYWGFSNVKKSELNDYYFDRFKTIKSGMIYGSTNDSQEELSRYHDETEICMHLDGYNGMEIMKIRNKAFSEVLSERKNSKGVTE